MTFFDTRQIDKLTPQQRAQYEQFLKAYPQLSSKMDTSRELNTPLAQAVKHGEMTGNPLPGDQDELDLQGIENDQRAQGDLRVKPKPIAEMKVDAARASMKSLDQEEKEKERRARERLEKQRAEEARQRATEDAGETYQPPQQARQPMAPTPTQPKAKPPKFSTTGKRHPILQKMRQSLGMDELETPVSITVQGVKYSLKRLMREDITKAITTAAYRAADDTGLRSFMETAIVAYAIREIDETSVSDVFDVPYRELKMTTGREENLTSRDREDKGAHLLFEFLVDSPTELTETLITFYEQNFPPVNLLDSDSTLALCPTANCQYKAIIGAKDTRYCPLHGKELRKEGDLPNPS